MLLQMNNLLGIHRMFTRKKIEGAIKVCDADKEHLVRRALNIKRNLHTYNMETDFVLDYVDLIVNKFVHKIHITD